MEPIHTEIELKKLVLNTGQIEGLPANPRKIDVNAFSKLKENITNNPEMLALRGLIVYETEGGKYVVIGGNMRLRAMRELGTFDKAPYHSAAGYPPWRSSRPTPSSTTGRRESGTGQWSPEVSLLPVCN